MLAEQQTTLALDPDEVHRLGVSEVARIQREMDRVRAALGYQGDLRGFFDHIRVDPRYHPKPARNWPMVSRLWRAQSMRRYLGSSTPCRETKLVIQPYPAFREKYEAGGSYSQGSADTTRPGIFFYNTYDLPSRF